MRSPLDMGGFPIINAAPGSDPTDLATVEQAASNGVPLGSVVDFAGTTAPTGYLLCYGQAIGRSEYIDLFTAIGTVWGIGDGETTFKFPDLPGRVGSGTDEDRKCSGLNSIHYTRCPHRTPCRSTLHPAPIALTLLR